ncbi:MAG: holin [Ruminococcus sp.]|nr:holin [Ruminococcus sp.]
MSNNTNTNTNTNQSRWKSWALWVSVLGLVGLILQTTGVFEMIGLDGEEWDSIVTSLGTILTAFGILNNPTAKDSF